MTFGKKILSTSLFLFFYTAHSTANGLEDLHKALATLTGSHNITATLSAQHKSIIDENDITTGDITLTLKSNQQDLQIQYNTKTLHKLAEEQTHQLNHPVEASNSKKKEKNATKTQYPTIEAMKRIEPIDMLNMLSSANALSRFINAINFIKEENVELNNEDVRLLTFNTPINTIIKHPKTREYVDEFDGKYHLWINKQGIPLQAELSFKGKGSFYLIFSIKAEVNRKSIFRVVNNRLVTTEEHRYQSSKHSFGSNEYNETNILTVQ